MLNNPSYFDDQDEIISRSKVKKLKAEFERTSLSRNSWYYNHKIRIPNIYKIKQLTDILSYEERICIPKYESFHVKYKTDLWTVNFYNKMLNLLKYYYEKRKI